MGWELDADSNNPHSVLGTWCSVEIRALAPCYGWLRRRRYSIVFSLTVPQPQKQNFPGTFYSRLPFIFTLLVCLDGTDGPYQPYFRR